MSPMVEIPNTFQGLDISKAAKVIKTCITPKEWGDLLDVYSSLFNLGPMPYLETLQPELKSLGVVDPLFPFIAPYYWPENGKPCAPLPKSFEEVGEGIRRFVVNKKEVCSDYEHIRALQAYTATYALSCPLPEVLCRLNGMELLTNPGYNYTMSILRKELDEDDGFKWDVCEQYPPRTDRAIYLWRSRIGK